MTIVVLAISVTVNDIFAIEMCLHLTRPLEPVKVKCKYANRKSVEILCSPAFKRTTKQIKEIYQRIFNMPS